MALVSRPSPFAHQLPNGRPRKRASQSASPKLFFFLYCPPNFRKERGEKKKKGERQRDSSRPVQTKGSSEIKAGNSKSRELGSKELELKTKKKEEAKKKKEEAKKKRARKKQRQKRKPGVTDGKHRRIRGMLSSLGTLMSFGNAELAAIPRLLASVVAKPGGLKKHCIKRWHTGLGTGPSVPLCNSVLRTVGENHLQGIDAYNQARELLPVSHANLDAKWLLTASKPAPRPTTQESRFRMKVCLTLIEHSGVRVDILRARLLCVGREEDHDLAAEIPKLVDKALCWTPPPRTTSLAVFEDYLLKLSPKLLHGLTSDARASKIARNFNQLGQVERGKHNAQCSVLNARADMLLKEWKAGASLPFLFS